MNKQPFPKFLNSKPSLWGFEVNEIMAAVCIPLLGTYVGFPDKYTLPAIGTILIIIKAWRKFGERGNLYFGFRYKHSDVEIHSYTGKEDLYE